MTEGRWSPDGSGWLCEYCHQTVQSAGPWCLLYTNGVSTLCRPLAKQRLRRADAEGDGALVNALCWMGRQRWGEDLDW